MPWRSQSPSRDDANCKAGRCGCCTSAHRLLHRNNPPSPGTPSPEQPGLIYLGLGGRSANPPCRINEGKPNHLGRLLCVRPRLVCSALNAGQQPQSRSQPLATLLVRPSRPMEESPSITPDDHDIVLRGYEQLNHSRAVAPETKNATSTPCVARPPIVHIATTALNKIPRERSGAASCFCQTGDGLDRPMGSKGMDPCATLRAGRCRDPPRARHHGMHSPCC